MEISAHAAVFENFPSVGVLLAGRLRAWRRKNDIPIKRAAAELGVSGATWDHWEKCRRFPTMDDLNLLAQYLCLPPCMLLCPYLHCRCDRCLKKRKKNAALEAQAR